MIKHFFKHLTFPIFFSLFFFHYQGLLYSEMNEVMMANFENTTGNHQDGFPGWIYAEVLPDYNGSGFYQLQNSSNYNHSIYHYFNGSNNDHIGWMRWGFIDFADNCFVNGGKKAFRFQCTGGAYDDGHGEGENAVYTGLEVRSKEQYLNYFNNGENPLGSVPLDGYIQMYFNSGYNYGRFNESQGKDRFSVWVWVPNNLPNSSVRPNTTLTWFPFINEANGGHYYHQLSNMHNGGWTHAIFDAHPSHHNSGAHNNETNKSYLVGGYNYPGDAKAYFSNIAKFSLAFSEVDLADYPTPIIMDEIKFYNIDQPENDETINGIGVNFNPDTHEFNVSFEDKYIRDEVCFATYEARYSFEPITNINYSSAKLINLVDDTNSSFKYVAGPPGQIKKPSAGYRQIMARFTLDSEDETFLTWGNTVYIAVKDISNRTFDGRDARDEDLIWIDGLGNVKRTDLIKTNPYTIYPPPGTDPSLLPLTIKTTTLTSGAQGVSYQENLSAIWGTPPYSWSTNSTLPQGLSLNALGEISGTPSESGDFNVTIILEDSSNPFSTTQKNFTLHLLPIDIQAPSTPNSFLGQATPYRIDLSWNASNDDRAVVNYYLDVSLTSDFSSHWSGYDHYALGLVTNFSINNLNPDTLFFVRLRSTDAAGNTSNDTPVLQIKTLAEPSEFLLVDFGSSVSDNQFDPYLGWNQIFMDTYTNYVNAGPGGVTTVVGSNGSYNYQGVEGPILNFLKGQIIQIHWYNNSSSAISFTPFFSFDDKNRKGGEGTWHSISNITINPMSPAMSEITVDENLAGLYNWINVNNNHSGQVAILDKIILVNPVHVPHILKNIKQHKLAEITSSELGEKLSQYYK